jgi:hypothetical protein
MKKIPGVKYILLLIITFNFQLSTVNSQTLTPKVYPASGGYATDGITTLSWTMGETFHTTLTDAAILLSQGEQQPEWDLRTTNVSDISLCEGDAFTVSYVADGYYGAANIFTVQLSDAFGSFALPANVGTLASAASGTINCIVPIAIAAGANYKVRVVSSITASLGDPCWLVLSIGVPSVAATNASSSNTSLCSAGTVNLSAWGGTLGSGAQWVWRSGSCNGPVVGTGNPLNNVNVTSPTAFYVSAEGGCGGNTACVSVFVNIISCSCNGFRTQGIGAWKGNPSGNNAATYLRNNFASAFISPNFLTIGCTNKVILTTRNAVRTYISTNGTPAMLSAGINTNPATTNNTFASQLVSLALNIGFDNWDASFSSSTTDLKDLIVASGTFAGWTVQQVFEEANRKIGGCASVYTTGALTSVLNSINSNYTNGTVNNGFLNCPTAVRPEDFDVTASVINSLDAIAFPNPTAGRLTVHFNSDTLQTYIVRLTDLSGRVVMSEEAKAAEGMNVRELNVETLARGVYILTIEAGDVNDKLRIVVQ